MLYKKIEIYVTPGCPYCHRALSWLDQMGLEYTKIEFRNTSDKMAFYQRTDTRTVPQIFLDGDRLGGWTDLVSSNFKKMIEEDHAKKRSDSV